MPKILLFLFCLYSSSLFSQEVIVKFTAHGKTTVSGNLILLVSSDKFTSNNPGPIRIYKEKLFAKQKQTLHQDQEWTFSLSDLGDDPVYVAAYFDIDQNFLKWFAPSVGDWYSQKTTKIDFQKKKHYVYIDTKKQGQTRSIPDWCLEKQVLSQRLMESGLNEKESTIRFLVALPPSYHSSSKKYSVLYVSTGFNGNRYTYLWMFKHFYKMMKKTGQEMIVVSLDSSNKYGHHTFTNSEVNGPFGDVLAYDIVSFVDSNFRTKRSYQNRAIWGQSSGGWTALSVLWNYSNVFGHAFSNSPDPIRFGPWWLGDNRNIYVSLDGTERMLIHVPNRISVSFRDFVQGEMVTGSFGQYSSFLAVFSPKNESNPEYPFLDPFDHKTGEVMEEIWKIWEKRDYYVQVKQNPELARKRLHNRFHLYIGKQDEFGLYPPARDFSQLLDELKIAHEYVEYEKASHGSMLNGKFAKKLWRVVYQSVGE